MSPEELELYGETAAELLRRWDAGEPIWSVELGGLGPGYEQAIQVLAVELVRDNLGKPLPEKATREWGDDTVRRVDEGCCGLSGAQVGQSKWLAWNWLKTGPADLVRRAKEQGDKGPGEKPHLIQVSKSWPHA